MTKSLALRPIVAEDRAFLERVYASTRAEELAPLPWSDLQKAAFVRQQFDAQHQHYQLHYASARFELILADGVPAGRLYVHRAAEEILLIDIALLPEQRGAGIGASLISQLIEESRASGKPLTIHVERFNPAQRLYRRLGFRETGQETGVYLLMEWRAERPDQVKQIR